MGDHRKCRQILPLVILLVFIPRLSSGHEKATEIHSLLMQTEVTSRFARTLITMEVRNLLDSPQEAVFDVDLPKTAFITNFSMTVDNVTSVAAVKEKLEAERQYEEAVSRGRSAGLIQSAGRTMEQFKMSVNVGAGAQATFRLTYEELLKRHLGIYELHLGVRKKELVENFMIKVDIIEPQGISILETDGELISSNLAEVVKIARTETQAQIEVKPSMERQRDCPHCASTLLDGNLIIKYDVKRDQSARSLQVGDGYFAHYFAPPALGRIPKNVVFVIDRSGSMHGRKIQQTREAFMKILNDVPEEDHFGIIAFDSEINKWRNHLVRASPENIKEAREFVSGITPRGATDINGAIVTAAAMLTSARTNARNRPAAMSASLIIFLSDGQPTQGIMNLDSIIQNVQRALDGQAFLYCLGFGNDVDHNFLDKLALGNGGFARRIYEDSDSAQQLQGFYNEVAYPMLLDIELQYLDNGAMFLTQSNFRQYYRGSEIVVAGRLANSSLEVLTAEVTAQGVSGPFSVNLTSDVKEEDASAIGYTGGDFMERLWAFLTIEQLLTRRISLEGEEKRQVTEKALNLSLKYNFVTPLTSMVVTQPETEGSKKQIVADKPGVDDIPGGRSYSGRNYRKALRGSFFSNTHASNSQEYHDYDNLLMDRNSYWNHADKSAPLWIQILLCIFMTFHFL